MLKAITRISISLLFLFTLFPHTAGAQIAPTNSATISGSVSDSAGKPVINATVSLSGVKSATTRSDAHGLFVFVGMPFGTYEIAASAQGLGTAARSLSVEGDTNIAITYEPTSANGLKVIANVAARASAQFNVSAASLTQVSPSAAAFEGKTSWRTILEQIPGVTQAGLYGGSITWAAMADSPLMTVQISIDGSLPYETATLFDDMPLIGKGVTNAGTGTDLSVYPLNAFASADVVRGPGANSPSIVDSIGGTFVLHAPGPVAKNEYTFSVSTDPYGGIVANGQAAVRWSKLSFIATYGVNDSPGPLYNGTNVVGASPGYSQPAWINGHAAQVLTPSCPSTLTCLYGSYIVDPTKGSFAFYGSPSELLIGGQTIDSRWNQVSGSAALVYQFSLSTTAEVFYSGQSSFQHDSNIGLQCFFEPPAGYTGPIAAGSQLPLLSDFGSFGNYAYGTNSRMLEEKITTRIGEGVLRVAALQNTSGYQNTGSTTPGTVNRTLYGAANVCSTPASTDPNCTTGTYSLTIFNGTTNAVNFTQEHLLTSLSSYNSDLLFGYAAPLGERLRAGASFVRSYYNQGLQPYFVDLVAPNGAVDLSEAFTFTLPAFETTNEERVYIGATPTDKTSVDLSMYFVNADYHVPNTTTNLYNDVRQTYSAPRLGFVWRPTASMAIRAAAGGGFALAPINDMVGGFNTPTFNPGTGTYTVCTPNYNLQPERSFGFLLGTDIRLPHDTLLSFDLYRTTLHGQFYTGTVLTNPAYSGTSGIAPLYTTGYGNLGVSQYQGILAEVHRDVPRGLNWSFSGGFTRGYVVSVPAGFYNGISYPPPTYTATPCTNCTNLQVIPGPNFNGSFAATIPYAQAHGVLGYRWNGGKYVDLIGTYYGNGNSYFVPAFVELNGDVGYPLTKNVLLLLSFRNITGIHDSPIQYYNDAGMMAIPSLAGPPNSNTYAESYGPRTAILTLQAHL